jgi:uncharacterized protein YbjT (DUF2867 family)
MTDKNIIAVAGATGAQGGGLVRAILNDPHSGFAARAITRDVESDKARELKHLGAELIAADVDDEASLRKAFEARSLNPSLQTFEQWLARNAKRIPLG